MEDKAKEAAEDILGLNDTSVDGRLYLNGKEYPHRKEKRYRRRCELV